MGAFLEKPATDKFTELHTERASEFIAAASNMQGWRIDNEDAHCVDVRVPDYTELSWFAVFDGHGGSLVSKTSAENILKHITAHEDFRAARTVENIKKSLSAAFLSLDKSLRDLSQVRTGEDHSGSTGIGVIVTPTHYIAANCGDSRAVLIRRSGVVPLSWDHKPYNEGEQKRIEAAGGTVSMRRVNGDLAVSRALGDFVYKQAHTLPAEAQQVTADPDVHVEVREPDDEYLVVACDGIWDVFSNEEVCTWIRDTVAKGCADVDALAEELLDEGLRRGSRDNMTVVIVQYPSASKPSAELAASWKATREAAKAAKAAAASAAPDARTSSY